MDQINAFLDVYGLVAIFVVLLAKAVGIPIPIPADIILLAVASRSAEGRMIAWQTFLVSWLALVLGGTAQFLVIRTVGRGPLYRFGRHFGLTADRLDMVAARMHKAGPLGVGVMTVTPGLRSFVVTGSALAGLKLRAFTPGLALGSAALLSVYFLLGVVGSTLLATFGLPVALAGAGLIILGILTFFGVRFYMKHRVISQERAE